MSEGWTARDIPDQSGRTAVVTGANDGLGLITARELARAGASVVLACRDTDKGERALREVPGGVVEPLDLTDLTSVRSFAERFPTGRQQLDLLVLNAGVMAPPRRLTGDGFESQFATNHLGHFALTGLLLGKLLASPRPRVVTVSSMLHRLGTMRFDDLQGGRRYNGWRAYGQSKLANLMFGFELQRRATEAGWPLSSVVAHPGLAATNLHFAGPSKPYERAFLAISIKLLAQSAEMGALPILFAATAADVPEGAFIGPGRMGGMRGHPRVVAAAGKAYDAADWRRLWEVSEALTGVRYALAAPV